MNGPTVSIVKNPFICDRDVKVMPSGLTVSEIYIANCIHHKGTQLVLHLNGIPVKDPHICDIKVSDGDMITICAVIEGSSQGTKDVLRVVGMITVMAAAMYVAGPAGVKFLGSSFLAGAAGASIAIGGSLLLNKLLPAQTEIVNQPPDSENNYGWDPAKNLFYEGITIPVIYGTVRIAPMIISKFVNTDGERQYLNALYAVCESSHRTNGITSITGIEINENTISNYPDVTIETRLGTNTQTAISGFQRAGSEKSISTEMTGVDWVENTTDGNSSQVLAFGFVFPYGLCRIDGNNVVEHSIDIQIQYGLVSGGTGYYPYTQNETVTASVNGSYRATFEYSVAAGEYQVRARVSSARRTEVQFVETVYFEYLQEFVLDDFTYPNTALIGMKALATDQMNGISPTITCLVTNDLIQSPFAPAGLLSSSIPAWACVDLLCNTTYGAGIPSDRIIYSEFFSWATNCISAGYEVNICLESGTSLRDALAKVAICGRGSVVQRGNKFGCIFDAASSPVQLFTVGNIIADSFSEKYLDKANRSDVIEITFFDEENGYQRRTLEVASSGYDESTTEQKISQIELTGVTNFEQAAKFGKYMMNCQQYITRTITFQADVDAIACQAGDVISVQHDVPQWGYGGRVVSATNNTITLDTPMTIEAGETYVVQVRISATDLIYTKELVNPGAGSYSTFTLASGTWSTNPSEHDVYAFGKEDIQTKQFRVLRIERSSDFICTITAQEYRSEVYSDSITIPDYPEESDLPLVSGVRADDIYPVGNDGEIRDPYIAVTWRGFAVQWNVFIKDNADGIWKRVAIVNRTGYNIRDDIRVGHTYTVSVSTTDNPEDGGQDTVLMDIDPPGAVPYLTSEVLDNFVILKWKKPTTGELPVAYYDVLKGTTIGTAQQIGRADKTFTTYMELLAGDYTYWVRAVDTAGQKGDAVSTTVTLDLPTDYELSDQYDSYLDGAKSGFVSEPEGIVGLLNTTETWEEHFENNGYDSFSEFISAGFTYYFEPNSITTGYYIEPTIDTGATIANSAVAVTPEWRTISGNSDSVILVPTISTSLNGSDWTDHGQGAWQIYASNFRYVKYRIDVSADTGSEIIITGIKTSIILRNIEEFGEEEVTVANDGKVITFTKPFVDVSTIIVTPLYDAAKRLHAVYDFTDIPNPTSFTVYLYDEVTGAKATGNFSYLIKGV